MGLGAVGAAGQTAVSDGGWQQYRGLLESIYLAGVDFRITALKNRPEALKKLSNAEAAGNLGQYHAKQA